MKEQGQKVLEKNQKIGTNLTFEGEYLADFVERLDRVFEIAGVKMDGGTLKILVGELKNASKEEVFN